MDIQPIVLAGGKGTRMESELPKVLVPLKGKPLVSYLFDTIESIKDLPKPIAVIGYGREEVKKVLGDRCLYAVQEEQLGTGHAVSCALDQVSMPSVIVMYGDMPFISKDDLLKMIDTHNREKNVLTMVTVTVPDFNEERKNVERYGRVIRKDGKVVETIEYKDASEEIRLIKELTPSYFVFDTKWLKDSIGMIKAENVQHEYYLPDLVKIAIMQGKTISTVTLDYKSVLGANTRQELAVLEDILDKKR